MAKLIMAEFERKVPESGAWNVSLYMTVVSVIILGRSTPSNNTETSANTKNWFTTAFLQPVY